MQALGIYGTDSYRVMLRRVFKGTGDDSVRLKPGAEIPLAFAVWNGSAGDRDGKKSVTIWQSLRVEP